MSRKRVVRIPKSVVVQCPYCKNGMRVKVSAEESLQFIECARCMKKITTPMTQCCIVCCYSGKQCPYSLVMKAKAQNLEIRT